MTQWPKLQGIGVVLRRISGHLACDIEHALLVRLVNPLKEPEEFPLSAVQGFHCAWGDGLGLSFALEE